MPVTIYFRAGRMPTLLLIHSKTDPTPPIPDSRFPTPDSRFPTPCSLFPVPYSLFP
ncbi:MAG: hypothetical protein F6K26_09285 [Moorea sp. SIO2I5]|nr:hypothetical protein [Moorena sp. SIO2I5]